MKIKSNHILFGIVIVLLLIAFSRTAILNLIQEPSTTIETFFQQNSSTIPFSLRWTFTASLDRNEYSFGENLTLTVNLTSLIDHNETNYVPGWFRWLKIYNSTYEEVWHALRSPSHIYQFYYFPKGYQLGATYVFNLGTTSEIPEERKGDPYIVQRWIPLLPVGHYMFIVNAPDGLDGAPTHTLDFKIV